MGGRSAWASATPLDVETGEDVAGGASWAGPGTAKMGTIDGAELCADATVASEVAVEAMLLATTAFTTGA